MTNQVNRTVKGGVCEITPSNNMIKPLIRKGFREVLISSSSLAVARGYKGGWVLWAIQQHFKRLTRDEWLLIATHTDYEDDFLIACYNRQESAAWNQGLDPIEKGITPQDLEENV